MFELVHSTYEQQITDLAGEDDFTAYSVEPKENQCTDTDDTWPSCTQSTYAAY